MKCPNCNAETDKRICPYCGTEIPNAGRVRCPECGSRNTTFKRELVRSNNRSASVRLTKNVRTRGGGSTKIYRTIGLCQDCGNTWVPNNGKSQSKPWWFWVLVILFWPISLSIWFWKTKRVNMPNKTKGIILGAVWGVFLLFFLIVGGSGQSEDKAKEPTSAVEEVTTENKISDDSETNSDDIDRSIPETEEQETEPEDNSESKSTDITVAYATDVLNIREQPNTDCSILGKTELGDQVTILDTEGDWSHVTTNGLDGYIKSEYLSSEPIYIVTEPANETSVEAASDSIEAPMVETIAEPVVEPVVETQNISVKVANQDRNVSLEPGTMVWLSATGSKFHNKNNCGTMNPDKARQVTIEEAVGKNMEACENCY